MASRDIKVGIFVILSLVVLGAVVFLIGEERKLFESQMTMQAAFKDVKGLSRGSPVRMGGVDIGSVSEVGYTKNPKDDTIFVEMSIVSEEASRIRQDSYAEVKDKGLLGDKMIVITVGNPALPPIPAKGRVNTQETRDLEEIIGDLKGTISGAEKVVNNLEKTTEALADSHLHEDIKRTIAHLANVMQSIDSGEGYVPMLLKDKAEAERLSATVAEIRGAATELGQLLSSTRQVVDRVRSGPGFAHEVFYEQNGSQAISQLGGAAEELRLTLQGVREGRSLVHDLLYEQKSAEMVDSLNRASADLSAIVSDVRAGKGTLGSLLTDPSVYDDIKVLLGNVSRNRSLKALVRYSIKQDEQQHRVINTQASPPQSAPPAPAEPVDERADASLQ
jgi:phospholipid/cholesterol/gamma-HCH transport system substrate-binding protein